MAHIRKRASPSLDSESSPLLASDVDQMVLTENNSEQVDSIKPRLCSFQELPSWAQDNIYIYTGYRVPTNSYKLCFMSLFYLSNETGNIYSHLIGCLIFFLIAFLSWENLFVTPSVIWSDYFVVYTYIASAIICLGCSALFHLVSCHSEPVSKAWNKCDFAGIVFLIVGSFFPAIYYAFFCDYILQLVYLSVIILLGTVTLVFSVSNKYSTPKYRIHRTGLFLALGLSGLVPALHVIIKGGLEELNRSNLIPWFLLMGVLYISGAVIYGLRIPEKWYPGFFDYWFHSHQIFHAFVVAAALFHYVGIVKAYEFVHSGSKKCP